MGPWTFRYDSWFVRWAYLGRKGIPNETTVMPLFWRAFIAVPGVLIGGSLVLYFLAKLSWYHPWWAVMGVGAIWFLMFPVYFLIVVNQRGDQQIWGQVLEKYKVYFE